MIVNGKEVGFPRKFTWWDIDESIDKQIAYIDHSEEDIGRTISFWDNEQTR